MTRVLAKFQRRYRVGITSVLRRWIMGVWICVFAPNTLAAQAQYIGPNPVKAAFDHCAPPLANYPSDGSVGLTAIPMSDLSADVRAVIGPNMTGAHSPSHGRWMVAKFDVPQPGAETSQMIVCFVGSENYDAAEMTQFWNDALAEDDLVVRKAEQVALLHAEERVKASTATASLVVAGKEIEFQLLLLESNDGRVISTVGVMNQMEDGFLCKQFPHMFSLECE